MLSERVLRLGLPWTIRHWGKYHPRRVAIVTGDRSITYAELDDDVQRVTDHLTEAGIVPQQPVGVVATDAIALFAMAIGVLRAGAQVVLVNPNFEAPLMQRAFASRDCALVLVEDAGLTHELGVPTVGWQVLRERHVGIRTTRAVVLRKASTKWGAIIGSARSVDIGVVRTDLSMMMEMLGWALELDLRRDSICYAGKALWYVGGFMIPATTLLVGGTVLGPREHTPETYFRMCAEHAVQIGCLLEDQVRALVARGGTGARPHAKTVLVTGAAVCAETKTSVPAVLGSELVTAWASEDWLATIATASDLRRHPASIGRPFLCDRITIVDDDEREVQPGCAGRLAVSVDGGATLMIAETRATATSDGYVYLTTDEVTP